MRRLLPAVLFAVLSLIFIMVLRASLPKYAGMLLFLFLYLLLDGYLWLSVRKMTRDKGRSVMIPMGIIYWLPFALAVALTATSLVIPFSDWSIPVRTNLLNFILICFISKFLPLDALILADFIRIVQRLFRAISGSGNLRGKISRHRPLLLAGWAAGAVMFMILAAGTIFWQYDFRVKSCVIALKDLPPSFEGFRIVQFSDVHLGSWSSKAKLKEAMEMINDARPDVIFFTGDMFNFSTDESAGFEKILKTIRAPHGVYAIMGNHDYGDYQSWASEEKKKQNLLDLYAFYDNLGWKLLRNSNDVIRLDADSIAVIGVENWGATRRFQRLGDIGTAQQGTENMAVRLLLSHDPSHWDSIISKKFPDIDVTFSGHTHGGQIGIDCGEVMWSPVAWSSHRWSGLYTESHHDTILYLYINRGLGSIGYAGRVGILPEITLIFLTKDKSITSSAH